MAKYNGEELILTERYMNALHDLMEAEMDMMKMFFEDDNDPDCWAWGVCRVGDLFNRNNLSFEYGGEIDRPKTMKTNDTVVM